MALPESIKQDKALLVAEYFIWKNQQESKELNKLKLQKLLYYAQAWNLVLNKNKLFSDDIEAWIRGPVVPKVYQFFKEFDFENPPSKIESSDFDVLSGQEKKVLDEVWKVYGKYDGNYLETLTHNELPWQEARKGLETSKPSQTVISVETMQEYYGRRLAETKERPNQAD